MVSHPTHLEQSLQRDIQRIRSKVLEMGQRAEQALRLSLQALTQNNRQVAFAVILRDRQIDELEKEIDRLCLEFLVRQQPVAGHLRFAYATIKINAELERIGDYAESIARQFLKVSELAPFPSTAGFAEIAHLSILMLHHAVQAFVDQDAELARKTMPTEVEADVLRNQLNSDLAQQERERKFPLEALGPLMTIARRFERVTDQARNICEEVLYMCTGEYMKHQGAEVVRILFVDEHNSELSQMAEAIGNSLAHPKLLFGSAGTDPKPVHPRLVGFLKDKGIDISHQFSKSVEQVPNFEHYQLIVALDKPAQRIFPRPPTKTVALDWDVPELSQKPGASEQVQAAYDEAYQSLYHRIKDLVEAINGDQSEPEKNHEKKPTV